MTQKLKMGMVGGGRDAFIGGVHRMAARLDGEIELVAGAFSSDPEKAKRSGEDLSLESERVYRDYQTMVETEARLPVGKRIDFVSIVTPNHLHFPIAKLFLEAGFNVVCDKPMTFDLGEALALRDLVKKSGKIFALTHNYTGYPMAKEARELVQRGALGTILKIVAQYPQGWLLRPIDAEGQKQAVWRTNPEQAGASACVADIGTHAENLARYITSLRIEELCADFTTFVEGRRLEDDASLLLRYKGGARGVLCASQILAGEENDFNIRVYGTKASLEWHQERPDHLIVKYPDAPRQVLRRGSPYVSDAARRATRLPPGGPEAFIEAFANIYREAARAIRAEVNSNLTPEDLDFPTVDDGLEGMAFITTAVQSAKAGGVWAKMPAST
ncbi:MAG: Gfo/Idh/MocA family oxidoreductase [Alloacidobacterium sp.]